MKAENRRLLNITTIRIIVGCMIGYTILASFFAFGVINLPTPFSSTVITALVAFFGKAVLLPILLFILILLLACIICLFIRASTFKKVMNIIFCVVCAWDVVANVILMFAYRDFVDNCAYKYVYNLAYYNEIEELLVQGTLQLVATMVLDIILLVAVILMIRIDSKAIKEKRSSTTTKHQPK